MPALLPSAEVPLMGGLRVQMLKALEHPSLLQLSLMLRKHVLKELRRATGPEAQMSMTVMDNAFQYDQHRDVNVMAELLHAIPRDLLVSVIKGTVAYDLHKVAGRPATYSDAYPGTYVAAISIAGRGGRFLSAKELGVLVTYLRKYVAAYDFWVKEKKYADDDCEAFVRKVDGMYGKSGAEKSGSTGPALVGNDRARHMAGYLIDGFRLRIKREFDQDVFQTQGPLLVGCAAQPIAKRIDGHRPEKGLPQASYLWTLTLSMLQVMDLEPVVTIKPVLCIWDRDHLWRSEVLVMALAQSLVTQEGYNPATPGTHKGNQKGSVDHLSEDVLKQAKALVFGRESYLAENLKVTRRQIALQRSKLCASVLSRNGDPLEGLAKALEGHEAVLNELHAAVEDIREKMERGRELTTALERKVDEMKALLERRADTSACQRRLLDIISRLGDEVTAATHLPGA